MNDDATPESTSVPRASGPGAPDIDRSGEADGADAPRAAVAVEGGAAGPPFPWPPGEGEGVLAAAGRTWFESVFEPTSFFRRMPPDARVGPTLPWFIGVTILAAGIQLFWEMVLLAVRPPADDSLMTLFTASSPGEALISFFLSPFIMVAALFLGAGVWHLLLRMMGGATQRYSGTVRVFAFVQGPQLFAIVPFLGMLVGGVWSIAIAVIGLREAHRTSTGKALIAVLLPIVLLVGLFFVFAVILAAGALLLQQPL
jgi:hypothetical protein